MEGKDVMKNIALIFIAVLLATSCNETKKEADKLERVGWINGFWKMTSPQGTMTESWMQANDSTLAGVGKFTDTAGKVLTTEEIRIVLRKDKLWYIPTVSNQNMGKPVSFQEISFTDSMVVFEDKGHDFPQRIAYVRQSDMKMLAYIEGEVNGETERLDFQYERQ